MAHLVSTPYMGAKEILAYLDTFVGCLRREYKSELPHMSILIMGGSALCLKYDYRLTVDIDADVRFARNKKNAIKEVASIHNIPTDWLNEDVMKSNSYSRLLWDNSIVYTVMYGILEVRVVNDLDQLCMKATAGRPKDREDILKLVDVLVKGGYTFDNYNARFMQLYNNYVSKKVNDKVMRTFFLDAYKNNYRRR